MRILRRIEVALIRLIIVMGGAVALYLILLALERALIEIRRMLS